VLSSGFGPLFPEYEPEDPRFAAEIFANQVRSAVAVLADLSGERPSCYFELGFAEALSRPVRLVAVEGTPIHQSSYRELVRFYSTPKGLERAVTESLQGVK